MKCLVIFAAAFAISELCNAQVTILADTLVYDCRFMPKTKGNVFLITSQEEYDDTEFVNGFHESCLPFTDVDFEKTVMVGYKYSGSNCDGGIEWSAVVSTNKGYTLQFSRHPNVCRDRVHRLAWFIVDKRFIESDFEFEIVDKGSEKQQ
jgi:hypothetical protein